MKTKMPVPQHSSDLADLAERIRTEHRLAVEAVKKGAMHAIMRVN
jgi:hypothetical protein